MKKSLLFVTGLVIGILGTLAALYVLKLFPQEGQGYLLKPYYYPQLEYGIKSGGSYVPVDPELSPLPTYDTYMPSGTYTQSTGTYVPVDPEL